MKAPLDTSLAYKYFMSYRLFDGQRFDEIIVPYTPARSFSRRLKECLKKTGNKLRLAVLLFFLSMMAAFHATIPLLCLVFLCSLVPAAILIYSWLQPTHIALSPKGFRLYHVHWFGDKATTGILWGRVGAAGMLRTREGPLYEDWVVLWDESGETPLLKIRLNGIASGEHRRRLLSSIKQFLPVERIDLRLQDALNPVRPDTHTALWLQVLSSSPKRLSAEALAGASMVGNGRYRIIEQLGAGGQGTAYVAESIVDSVPGVEPLKVVLKEFVLPAEASLQVSKRAFEKIEKEARLLSELCHPQIVQLKDLFVDDHRAYLVLEHVPGKSLRQIIKEEGSMREADVVAVALQLAGVLEHLHTQEPPVIHRDFTPENVILMPDGQVKLIDFDVAQQLEAHGTRTIVGKHSFISPEQFKGKPCPQSDIYALGASLYFLLTGEDPLPISVANPRAKNPLVSGALNDVVARCTSLELSDRFPSARSVAEALNEISVNYVR